MDIEGTTTIVCGSWLKCSIDFHSGTSFFCNRSNSACESGTIFSSDIRRGIKPYLINKSSDLPGVTQASSLVTAFVQKSNRDGFFHRQPRAFCQPSRPVQTAPCTGRENFPASVAEFSDQ